MGPVVITNNLQRQFPYQHPTDQEIIFVLRGEMPLAGKVRPGLAVKSRPLFDLISTRRLPSGEECLDQLALTANHHLRESLEPLALWHLGVSIHPSQHQPELQAGNVSLLNSLKEMCVERRR